jgi:hypothetical protein
MESRKSSSKLADSRRPATWLPLGKQMEGCLKISEDRLRGLLSPVAIAKGHDEAVATNASRGRHEKYSHIGIFMSILPTSSLLSKTDSSLSVVSVLDLSTLWTPTCPLLFASPRFRHVQGPRDVRIENWRRYFAGKSELIEVPQIKVIIILFTNGQIPCPSL